MLIQADRLDLSLVLLNDEWRFHIDRAILTRAWEKIFGEEFQDLRPHQLRTNTSPH